MILSGWGTEVSLYSETLLGRRGDSYKEHDSVEDDNPLRTEEYPWHCQLYFVKIKLWFWEG